MWKSILGAAATVAFVGACTSAPPARTAPRTSLIRPAPVITTASVQVSLSADQARLVRSYLSASVGTSNGRGRGRSGGLPPGIAKNLERGKPLPPGIAKSYLPSHVLADLPELPSGWDYVIVAGKLLLVEAATAAIHDILLDIAFDR